MPLVGAISLVAKPSDSPDTDLPEKIRVLLKTSGVQLWGSINRLIICSGV